MMIYIKSLRRANVFLNKLLLEDYVLPSPFKLLITFREFWLVPYLMKVVPKLMWLLIPHRRAYSVWREMVARIYDRKCL